MRARLLLAIVVAISAFAALPDVMSALAFGWVGYLRRVLPRLTVDRAGLAVAATAFALLVVGVHWLGRSVRGPGWRVGWSLAAVAGVVVAFAAGVCMVGATHQLAWLATTDVPIRGRAERPRRTLDSSWTALKFAGCGWVNWDGVYGDKLPDHIANHSWITEILPYTAEGYVTKDIDMNAPWTAPHNRRFFRGVLPVFVNPDLGAVPVKDADGFGLAHFAANVGVLSDGRYRPLRKFKDGTANTLLIGEVNANFRPWGDPANLRDPARGVNRSAYGFGGPPGKGGALFGMADGSVRFVSETVSPAVLRALGTPSGGEPVEPGVLREP